MLALTTDTAATADPTLLSIYAGNSSTALQTLSSFFGPWWERKEVAERIAPPGCRTRLRHCHRTRHQGSDEIRVFLSKAGYPHIAGVQTCGYWRLCPLCARRMAHVRKQALGEVNRAVLEQGGQMSTLLLSFAHDETGSLPDLLDRMQVAIKRFGGQGRGALSQSIPGWWGWGRNLGFTHGENGWHPHVHGVLYHQQEPDGFQDLLAQRWVEACEYVCVVANLNLVQPGPVHSPGAWAAYLQQFDSGDAARRPSTPWDLLLRSQLGDTEATALWQEYAAATLGKRLYRAPHSHLRHQLGLGTQVDDEQLAYATPSTQPALTFSAFDWANLHLSRQPIRMLFDQLREKL